MIRLSATGNVQQLLLQQQRNSSALFTPHGAAPVRVRKQSSQHNSVTQPQQLLQHTCRPSVVCAAQTAVLPDVADAAVQPQLLQEHQLPPPPPQQQQQQQQQPQSQQLWRADSVQCREHRRQQRSRSRQANSVSLQEHDIDHHQQQQLPHTLAAVLSGVQQQQQQQQQKKKDQAPYIPADSAAGRDRQLTAHISRRRHWIQLQAIWLDNTTNFSPVHLTASIVRLARLVEAQGIAAADRPELFKFSSAILSSVHLIIDVIDPRGAVQCLWAYAKLQSLAPHRSSSGDAAADALAAVIARAMQQLRPQELSQAAWAAAVLQPVGLSLPQGWWSELFVRLQQQLQHAQPAEVACCAWAAAKARFVPHEECIAALLQHSQAISNEQQQQHYGPAELLQLLQALAAWQQQLPEAYAASCCEQLQQLSPQMAAQDVSQAMLALARLQLQPPLQLLSALLQRLQQQLPTASPQVLVAVPYALAKLRCVPGEGWWGGFLPYTTVAMNSLNASGLAVLAWSFARIGVNPGKPWLEELLQQSGYKMGGLAAQEIAMLSWALGRFDAAPSVWWWERFEKATVSRREDFTAAELAAVLGGVAGMHLPPVPASSATAAPQQQQQQQQRFPSCSWTAQLLSAAQSDLAGAPTDCLAGIFIGLAKLSIRPSAAWLDAFEAAAVAALPDSSLSNAAAVLWGYAALEVQPSRQLVNSFNARLIQLLQDGSSAVAAAGSSSSRSSAAAAAAAEYEHASTAAAAGLPTAAVTAQLLWALVHQRGEYQAPWIDDLLQAAVPGLAAASSHSLAVMLWCLGKLRHGPAYQRLLDAWWGAYAVKLAAATNLQQQQQEVLPQQQQQQQQVVEASISAAAAAAAAAAVESRTSLSLITAALYCFARVGRTPSGTAWLDLLLEASQPLLPAASVQQLGNVLGQLVQLRVAPGEVWLGVAAQVLRQQWRRQQGKDGKQALLNAQGLLYQLGYGGPQ